MSLKNTKEQLILQLSNADNNVIAVSGKWGTGKTHLWNEVKDESVDDKVKKALYVSLFGQSSIDQIKRKLIATAIPGVESHGGTFATLKNFFRVGVTALSTHYKALAAINDLNVLLMAPVVLRDKVIVIDDIERKHEKLGIDEILGFIDEYSMQYGSRFVLLLNDDQLSSKEDQIKLWATFREKVIDQEIRLSTTSEEAFSIAISLSQSKYSSALKKATVTCGLTNIRIVLKVIRIANQLLSERELEEAILARVIPSIVFFSAIHYRGLVDGPDFKFALNAGSPDWYRYTKDTNQEQSAQEKQEAGWRILMQELQIYSCDDFEKQLVEFLESGLFDAASIEALIEQYVKEKEAMQAREAANIFLKKVFWDHRVDEAQLVNEAATFPPISHLLDPFLATQLNSSIEKFKGGAEVGQSIIDGWIKAFKASNQNTQIDDNPFNNPLHKDILAKYAALKTNAQAKSSVVDACIHIIENNSWGTLQEVTMRQATVEDFEAAIRGIEDLVNLRRFMRRMIEMRLQKGTFDSHFGSTTERFMDACRTIANDSASPRLAGLVKRLFEGTALASELNP